MIDSSESSTPNTAFLREWLNSFVESELPLTEALKTKTHAEQEEFAARNGFRTFRSAQECQARTRSVLAAFCHDAAFQTLWRKLAECDAQCDGYAMSPANGGVPARLLRAIAEWYQRPKLTQAELRAALKRMEVLSSELIDLLGTISPNGHIDPFLSVRGLEDWQVTTLFRHFVAEPPPMKQGEHEAVYRMDRRHRVQFALKEAGITPAFVLNGLKETTLAQHEQLSNTSPLKIRGAAAMKSHMVRTMLRLLNDATMFAENPPAFEAHLVAALVAIVCDTDCTSDDVYKSGQWKSLRLEVSRPKNEESSTEKK